MSKIVDLTYPIHEGMTTYPSECHPRVRINQIGRHGHEGRETREVTFGTHTGTHMDAPCHFVEGGASVDDLEIDACIGSAYLVDVSDGRLDTAALRPVRYGRLLLRFGWGDRWGGAGFYDEWPNLPVEVFDWFDANGIRLVGLDTPSPDAPGESDIHRLLFDRGIVLLEYLANLDQLEPGPLELYALPMNLAGCDGAPARVVAVQ